MGLNGSDADGRQETRVLAQKLSVDELYRRADLSAIPFLTTADIEAIDGLAGQPRAAEALRFGTQIRASGFNLCIIGSEDARMEHAIKAVLVR
ncbi:hypothetical protein WOC76_22150 [Methylocystis sp. IM3]|uniref:hypothetical protein n=1 Tax=unclassified Methylocystis TaxID=2625913 RepID=UPI0030F91FFD